MANSSKDFTESEPVFSATRVSQTMTRILIPGYHQINTSHDQLSATNKFCRWMDLVMEIGRQLNKLTPKDGIKTIFV